MQYGKVLFLASVLLASCGGTGSPYILQEDDITVNVPQGGFKAEVDVMFRVTVTSVCDDGVSYSWSIDGEQVSLQKNLEYMFSEAGSYDLVLDASQDGRSFSYGYEVEVTSPHVNPGDVSAYVSRVIDYCPAPGQFVNTLPEYEEGDTASDMAGKALERIGFGNNEMISLGGFGGYVTVGFDHRIENREGLMDFRILGNAFYAAGQEPLGNSCEPGVVMVAADTNGNGLPDDDEWYEISGSAHRDASGEAWYSIAEQAGNDVRTIKDYEITYQRPVSEPDGASEQYIQWSDNQGGSGFMPKNTAHKQPYYPMWTDSPSLTFKGTRLPQNGIDQSGSGTFYMLYKFAFGYADNALNTDPSSCIDIDWAVDAQGNPANLEGIDFIRIYTGVNQINGWIGECSTEIIGVEDLHVLGESISSSEVTGGMQYGK